MLYSRRAVGCSLRSAHCWIFWLRNMPRSIKLPGHRRFERGGFLLGGNSFRFQRTRQYELRDRTCYPISSQSQRTIDMNIALGDATGSMSEESSDRQFSEA